MVPTQGINVVEIEVDNEHNRALIFGPASLRVRGAFDLMREKEPLAMSLHGRWPKPIPGQRLRVDLTTGHGYLIEPLRFEEHRATREQIEKGGSTISEEVKDFGPIDITTWVYWMSRAVRSGAARLTAGDWPELQGKPVRNFHRPPAEPREDKIATALNSFATALSEQTKVLAALIDRK